MIIQNLPKCLREEIKKLVPSALLHEVTCFVLNDNHPCDNKIFDVVVCTSKGVTTELLHREVVSSLSLCTSLAPIEIIIHRNTKNKVFFLVLTSNELFIVCRESSLALLNKISNFQKCLIEDPTCNGKSILKVWCCDDALPVTFTDDLEAIQDTIQIETNSDHEDTPMLITSLETKLNEAKFVVAHNQKLYEDVLHLRQTAAFSMYQNIYSNVNDAAFKNISYDKAGPVRITNFWMKMCNGVIVIALEILNDSDQTVGDLDVIVQGESNSMVYKCTIFKEIDSPPYWKERHKKSIDPSSNIVIALTISIDEFKTILTNRVQLKGTVLYKIQGKEHLLPFNDVSLSTMDALDEKFDVLSSKNYGKKDFLAILSTTIQMKIMLLCIQEFQYNINICDIFCDYLKMEHIPNSENIIIHRVSPYHALHGVILSFEEKKTLPTGTLHCGTIYSRCESQLPLLIKYIYDAVPYKLILLPYGTRVTSLKDNNSEFLDEYLPKEIQNHNICDFGSSLIENMNLILKYYDKCIVEMGESNNQDVLEMIGEKIDLLIPGKNKLVEFTNKLFEQMLKGVQHFKGVLQNTNSEVMIID